MRRRLARAQRLVTSVLDPRPWLHLLRLVHHVNYSHVVGAGSVVTRSPPPGSIAVGAPARVVGARA
jgi:serine acetyltransferase